MIGVVIAMQSEADILLSDMKIERSLEISGKPVYVGLLVIFRVGCALVVPGFDLSTAMKDTSSGTTFFSLMNMLSGDALSNGSILALGVSPYITASIVIQLLTVAIPSLERLSKQGEDGRRKIQFYTRIAALVLSVAQAVGIVVSFQSYINTDLLQLPLWLISAFLWHHHKRCG